jgi:hypothetical protein
LAQVVLLVLGVPQVLVPLVLLAGTRQSQVEHLPSQLLAEVLAVGVRMVITVAAVEEVAQVLLVLTHQQLVLDKLAPPMAETQPSKVRRKGIL